MTASFDRRTFTHDSADRRFADRHSANSQALHHQDIGYLLTAYADGQLASEGVMWVEEQLDRTPDLRTKLKEIRHLQAGLRSAFAGGAPAFALDLPRRDALLASAANPSRKRVRFSAPLWIGLAASVMAMVYAGMQWFGSSATQDEALEFPPMRAYSINAPSGVAVGDPKPDFKRTSDELIVDPSGFVDVRNGKGNDAQWRARRYEQPIFTGSIQQGSVSVVDEKADGKHKEIGGRLESFSGLDEEIRKSLTPQKTPVLSGGEGPTREQSETQESIAVKPAVVVPSSPPPSPPFEQEKDAQILERPTVSSFNGQRATGKYFSGSSTGKTEVFEPGITMWNGADRQDISAAELDQSGADGYVRLNETPVYNGASTQKISRDSAPEAKEKISDSDDGAVRDLEGAVDSPILFKSAFTKVGSDGGSVAMFGDRSKGRRRALAKGGGVLENESEEKGIANNVSIPVDQLDVPLEQKITSESEDDSRIAKGREEAVASSDTGSTGAFMAIGAGGGSVGLLGNRTGGAKRRALAKYNQDEEDLPQTKPVGTIVGGESDGKPVTVAVIINDAETAQVGGKVRITRNDLGVVEGRITALDNDGRANVAVDPATWNVHGAKIMGGDVVQAIIPPAHSIEAYARRIAPVEADVGAASRHAVALNSLLATSSAVDPQKSFATLRAPMTLDRADGLAQCLHMIGSNHIGYSISPSANKFLGRQVHLSMRDETTARGVLRAVRSVGLQAQFAGGLVKLDVAQRPLNPTDTQSFDLPTFKELFGTAPMQNIAVDPVQTVAIDADTASYSYAKSRIAAGQEIDPTTIKPEHFINAMPMDYPPAQGPEAFSLYAEASPSPFARAHTAWGPRTALVSIGAVAKPARADERRPLALTLAVDCSGSMAQPGALARVKLGLQTMTRHLRADDRVAIVAFGDQARVVLPSTPGNDQRALLAALDSLTTGGATNASEGLTLAYQMAAETAASGVESRVLLATDGGTIARADELLHRVTAFKDRGITLVVVGCGETYHAGPLQELATKGDGQHYFIGSDDEAEKLFSTTLLPDKIAVLAKDAKLQVTWNPQRVSHARLIGYDQRRLATKDFRNNAVDAGELSQDTQVTALFEVLLVDGGTGQLGTAAVRYHDTRRQQVRELACPLPGSILASQPSDRLRLLACAAATAEWLQRGWWSNVHLITPAEIATQLGRCPQPIAAELKAMIR